MGIENALKVNSKCDFCRPAQPPKWLYPATSFTIKGAGRKWESTGAWAACEKCASFIDQDNFTGLVKRVTGIDQWMKTHYDEMIELFQANRTTEDKIPYDKG